MVMPIGRGPKNAPAASFTPVIAMSAYMDRWSEDEFRRAGFRSRLRKPFKSTDLLSALKH